MPASTCRIRNKQTELPSTPPAAAPPRHTAHPTKACKSNTHHDAQARAPHTQPQHNPTNQSAESRLLALDPHAVLILRDLPCGRVYSALQLLCLDLAAVEAIRIAENGVAHELEAAGGHGGGGALRFVLDQACSTDMVLAR